MIAEAEAGEFHDFKNNKYPCGKIAVVGFLDQLSRITFNPLEIEKINNIRQRIINGDFDEKPDREDIEEMRKTVPQSMWDPLGLDKGIN